VEQHYDWFTEDKVSMDEAYQLWLAQNAAEQVEGFRMVGPFFLVESGLHKDSPDSASIAESLCGVASAALYEQGVQGVEVEATNGNVIAKCTPLGEQQAGPPGRIPERLSCTFRREVRLTPRRQALG
jgi:hypothetical protein